MKKGEPIRIGCIGDSITAGTGLANAGRDAFPAQLERLLPKEAPYLAGEHLEGERR